MNNIELTTWVTEHNYELPDNMLPQEAVYEIVSCLRSLDAQTRDAQALSILYRWLGEMSVLSARDYGNLFHTLIESKALLGEPAEDIFGPADETLTKDEQSCQKSFVALLFCILLEAHNEQTLFHASSIDLLLEQAIVFATNETDARSFTPEIGWIHIYAHFADLCGALFTQHSITTDQAEKLVLALITMVSHADTSFSGEEDDRIAAALLLAVQHKKSNTQTIFAIVQEQMSGQKDTPFPQNGFVNLRQVARAFAVHLEMQRMDGFPLLLTFEKMTNYFFTK